MNLMEIVSNELKDKHYTDFEKSRIIYLLCCQLFSFDTRWYYCEIFGDYDLEEYIKTRSFDLENIDSRLIVCHTFSKNILKPLLDYFTNLEAYAHEGGHSYVMLKDEHEWKLDATLSDLFRVKLNLPTNGFTCRYVDEDKVLADVDNEINYKYKEKKDYYKMLNHDTYMTIIECIGKLLSKTNCKYHYYDARTLFTFLSATYYEDFQTYTDSDYNFMCLMKVLRLDYYYRIYKENEEYKLGKLDKGSYKELTRTLRCR